MIKLVSEVISWSKALLFALTLSIIISAFVIQPFSVMGSSMEPTLDGKDPYNDSKKGDFVLVSKSNYTLGEEPKYNDIVIIDSRIGKERSMKDNLLESPIVFYFTTFWCFFETYQRATSSLTVMPTLLFNVVY